MSVPPGKLKSCIEAYGPLVLAGVFPELETDFFADLDGVRAGFLAILEAGAVTFPPLGVPLAVLLRLVLVLVLSAACVRRGGCRCRSVRRGVGTAAPAADFASSSKAPASLEGEAAGSVGPEPAASLVFFVLERVRGGDDAILLDCSTKKMEARGLNF